MVKLAQWFRGRYQLLTDDGRITETGVLAYKNSSLSSTFSGELIILKLVQWLLQEKSFYIDI